MKDILSKKKLTDIFLRKEDRKKEKEQIKEKQIEQFDQSYYDCQIVYTELITSLIKVTAIVNSGPNAGQFLPLNCKWYIKNKFDFKQIQDVRGACFQPCLDDIGNIICVQAQPFIQGKKYTGITIMKQTFPLHLDEKLETLCNQFFLQKKAKFFAKIEAIFSQNPNYQFLQYPLQGEILLQKSELKVIRRSNQQFICQYQISDQYPQIDFIRKSYSSILFNCSQIQSMRISFQNNFDRDLFALIVRSIPRRKFVEKKLKKQEQASLYKHNQVIQQKKQVDQNEKKIQEKSFKQKESENSENTTILILKIDDLNKQIKTLKRKNEQMTANFNSERNAKKIAQKDLEHAIHELNQLKTLHSHCQSSESKVKVLIQQNKFYFSEISLIKNQVKDKIKEIKSLNSKLQALETQLQQKILQINELKSKPKQSETDFEQKIFSMRERTDALQLQIQSQKQQLVSLQDQNNLLRKKISSITNQKYLQSPTKPMGSSQSIGIQNSTKKIKELEMKISNLQMLLKYKSGEKGNQALGLHQLVNILTENISQKEEQIISLKKINKQLLKKIQ